MKYGDSRMMIAVGQLRDVMCDANTSSLLLHRPRLAEFLEFRRHTTHLVLRTEESRGDEAMLLAETNGFGGIRCRCSGGHGASAVGATIRLGCSGRGDRSDEFLG